MRKSSSGTSMVLNGWISSRGCETSPLPSHCGLPLAMPRGPRLDAPGVLRRVMLRGIQGRPLAPGPLRRRPPKATNRGSVARDPESVDVIGNASYYMAKSSVVRVESRGGD